LSAQRGAFDRSALLARERSDEFAHGFISQALANCIRSLLDGVEIFVEGAARNARGLHDIFSYCSVTASVAQEDRQSR
jgi:hypothetical protein